MGMLIQLPIEQTPRLLYDADLVVLNIVYGIHLLLCKVCNVCLELKPCQVHNHLFRHDNCRAPKRSRNGGQRRVNTIPHVMDFIASFDEIEFTQLQDPRLEKYTTSPPHELLPVVPGILVLNGYRCKVDGCAPTALQRGLSPIIVWPTIFSYQFMLVVNRAKCSTFSERSGTMHISVSTTKIWSLQVTPRGSDSRSKYMFH
jgi:hypothetical protein